MVLLNLAVISSVAFVFGRLARRMGQPVVVGEIVAGLALGPSLLGLLPGDVTEAIFPSDVRPVLQAFAQLGLVLFMFGIGLDLNLGALRGSGRQVTAVSLASVALPFGLGAGLAVVIHRYADMGGDAAGGLLGFALFIGVAMSITAFPVLARIINDRRMRDGALGTIALACAAVQDFLAWCVLAVVVAVVTTGDTQALVWMLIRTLAFAAVLLLVVRPLLARWLTAPRERAEGTVYAVLVCGLLVCAWATSEIGLHAVFGAFAFGVIVPREAVAKAAHTRIEHAGGLLLPVFFAVTGLSVDLRGLGAPGLFVLLGVIVVACAGKFAGAVAAARLTGMDRRRSWTLGVLLNARGLTELIILNVGLSLHVLDRDMFTIMVIMAVVTTLMTGPLLDRVQPKASSPAEVPPSPTAPTPSPPPQEPVALDPSHEAIGGRRS